MSLYAVYDLGAAWPDLTAGIMAIHRRVAALPWVPRNYLDLVARASNGGRNLVKVTPGSPWADTPERAEVWREISKTMEAAQAAYSNGRRVEGLKLAEAADKDAAFWNAAYDTAVTIRDTITNAPAAIVGGAADVAGGAVGALIKRLWWVIVPVVVLVAGAGYLWLRGGRRGA